MLLALVLGGLGACGDGGDERVSEPRPVVTSPSPSSPTSLEATATSDPVVAAYESWLAALEAQDAAGACYWHAPEFTIELRYRAILEHRAELGDPCTGFVALLWEDPQREYDPVGIEVTHDNGEDAELAVDFPDVDETASLQLRNGRWRVADVTPRTAGADTERWVRGWCDLRPDMTREQVVEVMGEPSGEYTVANGGEPQLWWADRQYDFRVYLDLDDTILDLVGDYDRLSAADRQLLDCPELR